MNASAYVIGIATAKHSLIRYTKDDVTASQLTLFLPLNELWLSR